MARKWNQWKELAGETFPFDWPIKVIVHPDLLSRVAHRFHRVDDVDGDKVASKIAKYWQSMISNPSSDLQIAIAPEDYGRSNRMVAGNAAALFEHYESDDPNDHTKPVSIWTSGTLQVEPIVARLMETWNNLPERATDPSVVGDWLARHIR